jgi:hypothetical protein
MAFINRSFFVHRDQLPSRHATEWGADRWPDTSIPVIWIASQSILPEANMTVLDEQPTAPEAGPGMSRNGGEFDKKAEVHFLSDEFGIEPHKAAALITDTEDQAVELAAEVMAEERGDDPLAGLPVPGPEKDPEHLEKEVADLEKPVEHRPSAPT